MSSGLTAGEAAQRLSVEGSNDLPIGRPRSLVAIVAHVFAEPMFLLLGAAAGIYLFLGERSDALILLASVLVIVAITVVQERRTENTLAALRDLSSPRALVVRDGKQLRIAGREVVRGDIIVLQEGDRVPADGIVRSAIELNVDESVLTGESLPVAKQASMSCNAMQPPNSDAARCIFSGTLVVGGHGTAEAMATGVRSEIGRIGHAIDALPKETTPLFRETRRIVRSIAIGGVLLCSLVTIIYGLMHADWLAGALAGITLAMGILPEEFPVVLTVFLAIGAWRISRHGVLTKGMPAIETIGATTLLAVDKTGTLTENRMRVAILESAHGMADLRGAESELDSNLQSTDLQSPGLQSILSVALAASERQPFDPMEVAIHTAAKHFVPHEVQRLEPMQLLREFDLTPELSAVTHVWHDTSTGVLQVAIKGAPETIFDLCKLDLRLRKRFAERAAALGQEGLRVLGVARGSASPDRMPNSPREIEMEFLGLLALADPVRATVPAAIAECVAAGIRVVMITGDHPGTARTIAKQAGLDTSGNIMTGAEIAQLSHADLRERVRTANVFARIAPEQKLRLVQAFKANGEIVAMTGDGVNDAPALRAAHIGVAMGSRGTDVAREAASLVLLNDDFASLVTAIELGRRIYANIRNAMNYLVSVHVVIAGMGLLPVLFGWPIFLLPIHVVFLEFIIDPTSSLVYESDPPAPDLMRQPPRKPDARLFSRASLLSSLLIGAIVLAIAAGIFGLSLDLLSESQARTLAFVTIVVANPLIILAIRRKNVGVTATLVPSRTFWWITAVSLGALIVAIYVPTVAHSFRFASPPLFAIGAILIGAAIAFVSITKWTPRHRHVMR